MSAQTSNIEGDIEGPITHHVKDLRRQFQDRLPVDAAVSGVADKTDFSEHVVRDCIENSANIDLSEGKGAQDYVIAVTPLGPPPEDLQQAAPTTTQAEEGENTLGGIPLQRDSDPVTALTASEYIDTSDGPADFTEAKQIGENLADRIEGHGFEDWGDIMDADDELKEIPGLQETKVSNLKTVAADKTASGSSLAEKRRRELADHFDSQDNDQDSTTNIQAVTDIETEPGEPLNQAFAGLPKHEDVGHPFDHDHQQYLPFYPRHLPSGKKYVEWIAETLAAGNYMPMLVGHAGVGKDRAYEWLLSGLNIPFIRVNCNSDMISKDFMGIYTKKNGETVFRDGLVPKATKYGVTLIIDEPNLLPQGVQMALAKAAERSGKIWVQESDEIIEPHPMFNLCFTMNPNTAEYGGTNDINGALESRIKSRWMNRLDPSTEADLLHRIVNMEQYTCSYDTIDNLVKWAHDYHWASEPTERRKTTILTPRDLLQIIEDFSNSQNYEGVVEGHLNGVQPPHQRQDEASLQHLSL